MSRFENIDWWCDRCGAFLNDQDGFSDYKYIWKCTECGHKNSISADNIYESHEDYYNSSGESDDDDDDDSSGGGCYLTSACLAHLREQFDDNCEELTILRSFRDSHVSKDDIKHYYDIAPKIVKVIDEFEDSDLIYEKIYQSVIEPCVAAIKNQNYFWAYSRYKESVLELERIYL